MFWLSVVMRWLHVVAAVIAVGGTIGMRFVVLPALERVPNSDEIAAALRLPFKRLIHSAIGLLLLTGFYNYMVVAVPAVRKQGLGSSYHPLMGIKIILSLVLFTIAILLLKPVPALNQNR